jgi:hypothetical protein
MLQVRVTSDKQINMFVKEKSVYQLELGSL